MNKCYFQRWESSERSQDLIPNGCSVHLTSKDCKQYITDIYVIRQHQAIPDEYEKVIGNVMECFISDELFSLLEKRGSVRLMEYEMTNLLELQEIIFKK